MRGNKYEKNQHVPIYKQKDNYSKQLNNIKHNSSRSRKGFTEYLISSPSILSPTNQIILTLLTISSLIAVAAAEGEKIKFTHRNFANKNTIGAEIMPDNTVSMRITTQDTSLGLNCPRENGRACRVDAIEEKGNVAMRSVRFATNQPGYREFFKNQIDERQRYAVLHYPSCSVHGDISHFNENENKIRLMNKPEKNDIYIEHASPNEIRIEFKAIKESSFSADTSLTFSLGDYMFVKAFDDALTKNIVITATEQDDVLTIQATANGNEIVFPEIETSDGCDCRPYRDSIGCITPTKTNREKSDIKRFQLFYNNNQDKTELSLLSDNKETNITIPSVK